MPRIGPGVGAGHRAYGTGGGSVPESSLFFDRRAYLVSPPLSEAAMVSTTPVTKTIVATTKNKYATSSRSSTTYDQNITRHVLHIGPVSMTELTAELHNWWFTSGAAGETIGPGTMDTMFSLTDTVTGLTRYFQWGGSDTGVVPTTAAAAYLVSDPLLPSAFGLLLFPAYSRWLLQVYRKTNVASATSFPWHGTNQSFTREQEYDYQIASATVNAAALKAAYLDGKPPLVQYDRKSPSSSNQGIATAPTWPHSSSGASVTAGGIVITGRANGKTRAIIFVGDSKSDGTNTTQTPQPTDEGNGWIGYSMRDPSNGLVIGSMLKSTMSGDRAMWRNTLNSDLNSAHAYSQGNIGVIALATNDIKGGQTGLQCANNCRGIAGKMKSAGIRKVIVTSCDPQTASSNGWIDTAGQSFTGLSMFDPSGTAHRQAFNSLMAADAAAKVNNIDGFMDFTPATDAAGGLWVPNGSADGIHELDVVAIAKGNIARSALLAIEPDYA